MSIRHHTHQIYHLPHHLCSKTSQIHTKPEEPIPTSSNTFFAKSNLIKYINTSIGISYFFIVRYLSLSLSLSLSLPLFCSIYINTPPLVSFFFFFFFFLLLLFFLSSIRLAFEIILRFQNFALYIYIYIFMRINKSCSHTYLIW
jgi:hypothetical protein